MPEEAHEFSLISTLPVEGYKIFSEDKMIYSCCFFKDLGIKKSQITIFIHFTGRNYWLES
jgi:hypothetical protein